MKYKKSHLQISFKRRWMNNDKKGKSLGYFISVSILIPNFNFFIGNRIGFFSCKIKH